MAKLYNLARMTTATTGMGTITLGSAVSGYLTFALAGVSDGDVVSYAINDSANSEIGTGTYTAAGTSLTRTVTKSTNSNTAISLSGSAQVFITVRAEDLAFGEYKQSASLDSSGTVTISNASPAVITMTGHGMTAASNNNSVMNFTTTGTLPVGLSPSTNYYVNVTGVNTFNVATSIANCIAGTFINTSSAGSGTHTANLSGVVSSSLGIVDLAGISLTAGTWLVYCQTFIDPVSATSVNSIATWVQTVSATGNLNPGFFNQFVIPALTSQTQTISSGVTPPVLKQLSSTTTIYGEGRVGYTGTAPNIYGFLCAVRVSS